MPKHILAIDDAHANLMLIEAYLEDEAVELTCLEGAEEGLAWLRDGNHCDAILLDRMMPGMDGMGFMEVMNSAEDIPRIPVIMQTAAASPDQVAEGIAAGVFYYLTKPYKQETLLAILRRALADTSVDDVVKDRLEELQAGLSTLTHARLRIRTLEDVTQVSAVLGAMFPAESAGSAAIGLREILLNAIEHGNLGVSYNEKSALLAQGIWEEEINRRLALPEQADRFADVEFERLPDIIRVVVTDCGPGFDWRRYITMSPERAFDSHGRGIAMAALLGFDELNYTERGNSVTCVKRLPEQAGSAASEANQASMEAKTA